MIEQFTKNPFEITKASDFSDDQINEYWVSFGDVKKLLSPESLMPKYILGGKGCGKTHLLRYFSFQLQKIRKGKISRIVSEDGYVGIYSILNGLNSSRFIGKGIDDAQWKSIFEYYFELYLADGFLRVINEFFEAGIFLSYSQEKYASDVLKIFYQNRISSRKIGTIKDLIGHLCEIRREIDMSIVNAAFTRSLKDVKILFSPGELIFGLTALICKNENALLDFKFLYILDEYEKLFDSQKIFINTLVWEKKNNCTFWVGARRYGYTTFETATKEHIRAGSEFEQIDLDDIIQADGDTGKYKKFAAELVAKRLISHKDKNCDINIVYNQFSEKLEKYSEDDFLKKVSKRSDSYRYKHLLEFEKNVNLGISKALFVGAENAREIIDAITSHTDGNPLDQKYKIHLFYREVLNWGRRSSLVDPTGSLSQVDTFKIIKFVESEYLKYKQLVASEFDNIRDKYKADFIAQLSAENNIKNVCYAGIDEFLQLSWGNPRVFLVILKLVIEKSELMGESPFCDGSKISLDAQYYGIMEASKWFYQDVEIVGESGKFIYKALENLAELFRLYRFSDRSTETSVCAFNYGTEGVSDDALHYINVARTHSLIIPINRRKQKNSGRQEVSYQLNRILAPRWDLPYARRGIADFDKSTIEHIFNPIENNDFEGFYKKIKSKFSAPFFGVQYRNHKKNRPDLTPDLFSDELQS